MAGDTQRSLTANFTSNASGFAQGANETIRKLRELNTQVVETKQKIKDTNAEIKNQQKELDRLKKSTNDGATATAEEKKRMQELKDAIAQNRAELGTLATAQQRLQSEVRNTNRELDGQKNAADNVSQAFLSMGDVLKANLLSGAITTGLQAITQGLQQMAQYSFAVGTSFEAAMSQVEAISGASAEQLEQLTNKAKELGSSTRFTATEAASAMNYMAMAGWDAEQMLAGIDGVLSLAAASGGDLGETADIVTDALTAFGMKAEDVGHFADVLAAASANANTNVSMLGESFKYVAPLAGTMGYSIDEVAEALGIMANSGIKASTAGTSMRTMLTNLTSGVTVSAADFGDMEISAANADGSMKGLNEVLGELREAFALMTEEERTNNAATIAGDRALSGFLALMNAGEADINKLRSAIEGADSAAANMAETMQSNVAGKVTIMQSAIEGLGIAIYDKFGDRIGEVVDTLTNAFSDLTERIDGGKLNDVFESLADSVGDIADEVADFISEELPKFVDGLARGIDTVIGFKTEIGSAVKTFIAFKTAMTIGTLLSQFKAGIDAGTISVKAFSAAIKANPIGLIATAIAGLTFGISELVGHMDDCNERMDEFNDNAEEALQNSQKYADEAEDLQDIADRYKEISENADDTIDKKEQLEELQRAFLERYGSEVDGINLVTGAYEDQAAVLQGLIDKKNKLSYEDALLSYEESQKAIEERTYLDLKSSNGQIAVKSAAGNARLRDKVQNSWNYTLSHDVYLTGSYEDRIEILEKAYKSALAYGEAEDARTIKNALDDLVQGMQQRDAAQAIIDSYEKINGEWVKKPSYVYKGDFLDYSKGYDALVEEVDSKFAAGKMSAEEYQRTLADLYSRFGGSGSGGISGLTDTKSEDYDKAKQLADDQYSVGEISASEYYNRLKDLRDTYLEENSHEWYVATKQIKNLAEQLGTVMGDAAEDDAAKVKAALNEIQQSYKDTIAEIDKEFQRRTQERTRKQEDEEYYKKREQLTTRLAYDNLDTYSRRSLEKELAALDKEREDVMWERSGEDRKQGVEMAYETGVDLLNGAPMGGISADDWARRIALLTDMVQTAAAKGQISNSNVNKYTNIIINNAGKTDAQIIDLVQKALANDAV